MDNVLTVTVLSPQDILYSGKATSVSSKNSAGNFDILEQHANFITIVEKFPIIIRTVEKKEVTFSFPLAVLYIANNKVTIYAQLQSPEL